MATVIVLTSKNSDNGDSLPMFEFNASKQPLPNTAVKLPLPWMVSQSEELSRRRLAQAATRDRRLSRLLAWPLAPPTTATTSPSLAVTSLEGMEGLEVASLEGMAEALVAMTEVKDHLVIMAEDMDMAVEATEAEAGAEDHPDRHQRALGPATMTGMVGMDHEAMDFSTNRARFSMRKLPRVLNISTPAYQEE